jgi:hypothetical protein
LRQLFNEWTCERKGHVWEVYKQPERSPFDHLWIYGFGTELKTHECSRCGEGKYKEREKDPKVKSVKFRRYSKLKVKKGFKK